MNQIWEDVKNLGHNEVVKNLIFDWFSFLETHEDISNYVKCKKVNKKKEQKEAQALHNQVIKEQKDTEKQDQKIYNQSLYHMLDGADNYKGVPSKGHQKGWIFDYVSILLRARFTGQLIKITVYSEIMYLIFYIIRADLKKDFFMRWQFHFSSNCNKIDGFHFQSRLFQNTLVNVLFSRNASLSMVQDPWNSSFLVLDEISRFSNIKKRHFEEKSRHVIYVINL